MEVIRIPRHDTLRFQPSLEARELATALTQMPTGALLSYDELRQVAHGKDVQRKARYLLATARRLALKEAGVVTWAVPGQGIQRLTPQEVIMTGEYERRSISRKATTAARRLACVEPAQLDASQRLQAVTYAGFFAAVALVSAFNTIQKLRKMADDERIARLEPRQVLRLFQ